jgi:hypothetical protein
LKTESGEHLKPRSQYVEEAVQLAVAGRWEEAVEVNRLLLEHFGPDQEAHNRLGKSLTEMGRLAEAKAAYEATLALNPLNSIAIKNSAKLTQLLAGSEGLAVAGTKLDVNLFVEEMGKTISTTLDDVTEADICNKVAPGDQAELRLNGDTVVVETTRGVRLGLLEPKLARRLIKFIQGGNRYQAAVTTCDGSTIKLMIRETYQDVKFAGKPSFPIRRKREVDFRPYSKESWIERDLDGFTDDERDEPDIDEGMSEVDADGLQVEDDAETLDLGEEEDVDLDEDQ